MKHRTKQKTVVPLALLMFLGSAIAVWAGGCTANRGSKYKNSVRGSAKSADCKSKDTSFRLCMKRSGPTGLKGCQSEFANRERACGGSR
ncbi:MAG: hypothetical protein VYA30_14975 [Myxococcota bacterium]|nr:hypothetical protein [Myxococcota bacterium]